MGQPAKAFGSLCLCLLFITTGLGRNATVPLLGQTTVVPSGVRGRPETICLSAMNNKVAQFHVPVYMPALYRSGELSIDLVACYEADSEEARSRGDLLIELIVQGTDAAPIVLKRPAIKVGEETLCRTDRSARQFESEAGNVTAAVISQIVTAEDFELLFSGRPVTVHYGRLTFKLEEHCLDVLRKLSKPSARKSN